MINTLNVILSNQSKTFCHYSETKQYEEKWISDRDLKLCFEFAKENNTAVNVFYPNSNIPNKLATILESENFSITKEYTGDSYVNINVIEISKLNNFTLNNSANMIFVILVTKKTLSFLSTSLIKLKGKFKKISITITDIEEWTKEDLIEYENELNKCLPILINIYQDVTENLPEINIITDIWFLTKENSCNAGISHYTVAPDGKLYICPAFYFSKMQSIGTLESINIINKQLLQYDHSPICKDCKSYHCNRCVYLNKKMTGEMNIPSYQQCIMAHLEMELSRQLLTELKIINPLFKQIREIPQNEYLDPLEKKINMKGIKK